MHVVKPLLLAVLIVAGGLLSCGDSPSGPGETRTPGAVDVMSGANFEATTGDTVTVNVRVTDTRGELMQGVTVGFVIEQGGGSLSASSVPTTAAGIATVRWRLDTLAGTNVLRASAGEKVVRVTGGGRAGAAAKLGITAEPGGARIGELLADQPVVRVEDRYGNPVPGAAAIEVLAAVGPSSMGAIAGTVTASTVNGVATFEDLELTGPVGSRRILFTAPGLEDVLSSPVLLTPPPRATDDRADDIAGPQVHFIYVLPSNGHDRALDEDFPLAYSIASAQRWLMQQLNGRGLRVDTYRGAVDVTFFRLSMTDEEMVAFGAFVVTEIERQLKAAGRLAPDKLYVAYYDGGSSHACGGAAWPPIVQGQVAALYLRGLSGSCGTSPLAPGPASPAGYWELAMLHDLMHTMGAVSPQAPNHQAAYPAHVPEVRDLLYSGPFPWEVGGLTVIDIGGDDYFGPNVPPGAVNLEFSPYFEMAPLFAVRGDAGGEDQVAASPGRVTGGSLPVHAPFETVLREMRQRERR